MKSNDHAAKADRPWTEVVAVKRAIRDAQLREHESANRDSGSDTPGTDIVDADALTCWDLDKSRLKS